MHEFFNALAQSPQIMIPGDPFAISPYPWRSAYGVPVALIDEQLWIVGSGADSALPPGALVGTLDLHECVLEPDRFTGEHPFFLFPALRIPGLDDSWADSVNAKIEEARGDWLQLLASEDNQYFDRHYGFQRPREVHSWRKSKDFAHVIEHAFAGRVLTMGHLQRMKETLTTLESYCPPHDPKFRLTCRHCGSRYRE